jgi:hypothetical protein
MDEQKIVEMDLRKEIAALTARTVARISFFLSR